MTADRARTGDTSSAVAPQTAPYPVAAFLCFGTPGECQNCGGSTRSIDEETGERGPFEGDPRFCSEDCFAESQMFAERARRQAASDWCPSCGFDRHEHADDCTRNDQEVPS